MTLTEFPQVQALSTRQKLELVDEIWKDVAQDLDSLEVTQQDRDLLDTRWAAFLESPSSALTIEQFKNGLEALRA
jgi:putative addiction module component (TIGR02574 family)